MCPKHTNKSNKQQSPIWIMSSPSNPEKWLTELQNEDCENERDCHECEFLCYTGSLPVRRWCARWRPWPNWSTLGLSATSTPGRKAPLRAGRRRWTRGGWKMPGETGLLNLLSCSSVGRTWYWHSTMYWAEVCSCKESVVALYFYCVVFTIFSQLYTYFLNLFWTIVILHSGYLNVI